MGFYVSHESIRVLASNHMMSMSQKTLSKEELDQRAQSTVSLRDIQRVFTLFQFFLNDFSITCDGATPVSTRYLHAMFLAIAVAYYMRLDFRSRQIFLDRIESVIGNEGTFKTCNANFFRIFNLHGIQVSSVGSDVCSDRLSGIYTILLTS